MQNLDFMFFSVFSNFSELRLSIVVRWSSDDLFNHNYRWASETAKFRVCLSIFVARHYSGTRVSWSLSNLYRVWRCQRLVYRVSHARSWLSYVTITRLYPRQYSIICQIRYKLCRLL